MNTSISPKTKSAVRLRPSPWDALVVIAVLALALALLFPLLPKGSGGEILCTVSQNGETLDSFPLRETGSQETRVYGDYTVVFNAGRVHIESAPCANQDCVHTGWISRAGQSIVCLPGRFVVELSATDGSDPGFDIVVK